jgi:hypothetical protein
MYFLVRPLFIVPSVKAGVEERRILECASMDNRRKLTAGVHKFQATKSCTVAFNIFRALSMELVSCHLFAPRI